MYRVYSFQEFPITMSSEELNLHDKAKLTHDTGTMRMKTRKKSYTSKKQAMHFGCFMNDNVRRIDYVLVYPNEDKEQQNEESSHDDHHGDIQKRRNFFQQNLLKEGCELEIERITNVKDDLTFVKIHTPYNLLCRHAEQLKIKMPLWVHDDAGELLNADKKQTFGQKIKDFFCCKDQKSEIFDPDTIIVWPFEKRHMNQYAIIDQDSFFLDRQRIEITYEILQRTPNDPADPKKRGVESLLEHGVYESAYALHDGDPDVPKGMPVDKMSLRQRLKCEWANWGCILKPQPLHNIRNYLGEKIGFYFAFMDFYVKAMIVPSILGLIVLLYGFIDAALNEETSNICDDEVDETTEEGRFNIAKYWMCPICAPPHCEATILAEEFCSQYLWSWRMDNEGSIFLSCVTCLWAILFLKFWRRRESFLACQWATQDAEDYDLVIRPDYEERALKTRRNPVTAEVEPFIPMKRLVLWFTLSSLATFGLLLLATAGLAALVISRIYLYGAFKTIGIKKNVEFARWFIHGCIFVMVSIFEKLYHSIAHKLTSYECPKTESKFMTSLLWKIFIFELMNDFVPIGYAAWLKGKMIKTPLDLNFYSELCDGGCMGEVTELVAVLLLARLFIGNLLEVGQPLLTNFLKKCRSKKNQVEALQTNTDPQWLQDFHLEEAELDGVYDEYMEMMVQFAFIVLFIPALPAAAAVCFLNNVAEIRVDAVNIMFSNRRPLPIRVPGIQIWNQFMDIIVKLGVICNAALLAFTSDGIVYAYYNYVEAPHLDGRGYTKFTLTSVDVEGWKSRDRDIEEMEHMNITHCYYTDFRNPYKPYALKDIYWQIFTIRVAVFAGYCLFFFIIMWLVNTFIADVPADVKIKVKRRDYVVHKAREAEAALLHTKWADNRKSNDLDKGHI